MDERVQTETPPRCALVITNPNARQVSERLEEALDYLRQQGVRLIIEQPEMGQHAEVIRNHMDGCDCVIVAGGDGSLNIAIDAVVESSLPLGILPFGTANDLARTLGIPTEPLDAADVIIRGQTRKIDLGKANGSYFFNVASMGMSVDISRHLTGDLKKRWGVFAYLWTALKVVGTTRPFRVHVTCDNETWTARTVQIAIGNGRYYGGGMQISEDAAIDDGMLDLYSLEVRNPWQIVGLVWALRRGTLSGRNYVRTARATQIRVEAKRRKPVNTDGEISTKTPVVFQVAPGALNVYAPELPPADQTTRIFASPEGD